MLKRILTLLVCSLIIGVSANSQVTTGSITGTVKDNSGHSLVGATVTALHIPTGSVYTTLSDKNGLFNLPNLRVGGPYEVTVSYVGFTKKVFNDLNVTLGTPLSIAARLESASGNLSEVVVSTTGRGGIISAQRNGTATNISARELNQLPTITRNINDFARLTPQAIGYSNSSDGSSMGISFAGQNNRYNQFTVDGANATDAFGLAASGTNGGQAGINPIPLDAIQEVQIGLSPYDVTQGGFTGGSINAVTKGGTNTFHGSVYGYYQNQNFVGKSVSSGKKLSDFKNETFGASLGGPIIKNKLFFFADAERYTVSQPLSYNPAESGSGSNFDLATLEQLRQFVITTYKWDPGEYKNINRDRKSTSVFGRIDWNINSKNKLTFRHSYVKGLDDNISRASKSMTFGNGGYVFQSVSNSSVVELTSNFSSSASNDLRITYNRIRDQRVTPVFPSLSISDNGLTYNIGSEQYSGANSLDQDIFTFVDNYTLYKGKHTLTFGTTDEFYNTKNVFLRAFYGNYSYKSIAAFENNSTAPFGYDVSYSTKGGADKAPATIHAAQFGIYGQDVWQSSDRFRLTYGLRIDMPVFFNKPSANTQFNSSTVATSNDVATNQVPKSTPLMSPRVGFNWDVNGNKQTQLRGGIGLFTGRVPFVWISNQYSNTGVESIKYDVTGNAVPSSIRFTYNQNDAHLGAYIPSGSNASTEIDITSRNFKYPQVLRTNLAIDQKLPWWGLIGTIEGTFTKTLNNINYQNLNIGESTGSLTLGQTTRPQYSGSYLDNNYNNVILLDNTNKGYSYTLTAQINKPFFKGWSGNIAYTLSHSFSLNDGTSSQAVSNWRYAYNINGLNHLDLTHSNFDLGSRVIAYITKTFNYNIFSTTIGLVYEGHSGLPFSYVYYYDLNGDDPGGSADLMYVPISQTDAQLSNSAQWTDLQKYIQASDYLSSHQGQNTERNADRMPWENHFDLKIEQGFKVYKMNKISVSLNVQNVGNLLDKKWGHAYYLSNQEAQPLDVNKANQWINSSTPTFTYYPALYNVDGKQRVYNYGDFTSRWRMQLGVRYTF